MVLGIEELAWVFVVKDTEEGVFGVGQKASEGERDNACMLYVEDEAVMANAELES